MLRAVPGARPLLTEMGITVQPYDIDFAAHVNNVVYVRWLEDLRLELLRRHCPMRVLVEGGMAAVVADTHIRYKKPVRLFDEPIGRVWSSELGRVSCVLHFEIAADGQLFTEATQRVMFVDMNTMKAMRSPQELRDAFVIENTPPTEKEAGHEFLQRNCVRSGADLALFEPRV
jgi:acyl-CoA thioester hydrolase